jgi:uncharacterized membrane protein (DUF485 family)
VTALSRVPADGTHPANAASQDAERIRIHPLFRQLASERAWLGRGLAVVMAAAYFGYILCVAFRPQALAAPLAAGWATSWGVVVGVALIALGFALTVIYVRCANARFEALSRRLQEELA